MKKKFIHFVRLSYKEMISYKEYKNILLLGEADFSFTKAFAKEMLSSMMVQDQRNQHTIGSTNNNVTDTKPFSIIQSNQRITASEYGNGIDIANRYFEGNNEKLISHIQSMKENLPNIHEIICNLNARNIGNVNCRGRRQRRCHDQVVGQDQKGGGRGGCDNCISSKECSSRTTYDQERKSRSDDHNDNKTNGKNNNSDNDMVCKCQRWNMETNDWDDYTAFWKHEESESEITQKQLHDNDDQKYDLIIFNFPHSDQAGRATKLVKAVFKQIRMCIKNQNLPPNVTIEMRLRKIEKDPTSIMKRNVRSLYNHEESANESGFDCIGCWESDLERWMKWGYEHKRTKKNETCRDIVLDCKVWRWRGK